MKQIRSPGIACENMSVSLRNSKVVMYLPVSSCSASQFEGADVLCIAISGAVNGLVLLALKF
jgi:hypothetical protein